MLPPAGTGEVVAFHAVSIAFQLFEPDQWADIFVRSGARYVVLTSKHHEGFCQFATKLTDYCAPKQGPGRDLVKEYVEAARAEGLRVGAVTQVCRPNLDLLPVIESGLREGGFGAWQLQLTMPIGRCGRDLAIDPSQVRRVVDFITDDSRPDRLPRYGADNIGWMLPCEPALRSVVRPTDRAFCGCQAGLRVMGLTSDGTVRGCLSMPPVFDEGNLRQRSLREIWQNENGFAYNRAPPAATGPCRDCGFVRLCRGGCKTLAHAAGRGLGENPYCARIAAPEQAGSS